MAKSSSKGPTLREDFLTVLGKRERQIELLKDRIASACSIILSRPEKSLGKLKQLVSLLDIKEDSEAFKLAFLTGQKLVAFSLLEVFKDLIPGYRVAEKIKEEDDNKRRLKRTTMDLRQFETSLLAIYKLYLMRLKRMVEVLRKSKSRASSFYNSILVTDQAKERIGLIGVKCLSELLITHPHFNFRNTIIQMIVPLMTLSRHPEVADKACESIGKLFREDKLGEVSLDAVKEVEKLIKTCGLFVRPQVIAVFLELKIKEIGLGNQEKQKKDMKEVRNELNSMSKKAKRRRKAERKLDNVLLETEAQESTKRRQEYHTKILNHVFVTYFRILKKTIFDLSDDKIKKERFKDMLTPVLEGLSKFCHLINVEFFDDLVNILFKLIISDLLDTDQSLNCCQTVFTILSDEGSALNIDHQRFYTRLYRILPNIDFFARAKTIVILSKCLETMIIKRRKINFKRALAFMKRITSVCLQTDDASTLALLSFIRRMFVDHPRADILLDVENTGSGLFMPHVEDPEYCNADASHLWELHLLRRHCNPVIQQFAVHILHGCSSEEIKSDIAKKRPLEIYEENESKELNYLFQESNERKQVAKKSRFHGFILESTSLTSKAVKMINDDCSME